MAKIKYSALVSDMRNSLNGSVLSKNRYGSYMRNKITPVNPQTVAQQNARAIFGNISKAWRGLAQIARNSWINGAKNFPFNDIFGDQKILSGQALFIKMNSNLEKLGLPRITNAPAPGDMPDFNLGQDVDLSTPLGGFAFNDTNFTEEPVVPVGFSLAVYMTDPVPAGINFVKNRYRFTLVGVTRNLNDEGQLIPTAGSYESIFGPINSKERVFIRYALVNNATGEQGVPREAVYSAP